MIQASMITADASSAILQSFLKDAGSKQFQRLTIVQVETLQLAIYQAYQTPAKPGQRSRESAQRILKNRGNHLYRTRIKRIPLNESKNSYSNCLSYFLSCLFGSSSAPNQPIQQQAKVTKLKQQSNNSRADLDDVSEQEQSKLLLDSHTVNSCDKNKQE